MRLLVVSNLYPPHHIGGYELGCRDIVEALKQREHEILVLTSTHGIEKKSREPGIWRILPLETPGGGMAPGYYLREIANRRAFRATLRSFAPELVYFWNQTRLPGALVRITRDAGIPYAFYLSDDGMLHWRTDSPWRWWLQPSDRPAKTVIKKMGAAMLRTIGLINERSQFVYHHNRQFTSAYIQTLFAGTVDAETDRVIPWGIDLQQFPRRAEVQGCPVRLLYVGRIDPAKGLPTAIRAVRILRERFGVADASLTVVGGPTKPDFLAEMHELTASEKLGGHVHFMGNVERARLPGLYRAHDTLVFPSEWEEPFAITPLEAMASGLAVVATTTGGSREIFRQGENAMTFAPRDAEGCARAVAALANDPALHRRLCENGRRLIEERYQLEGMVDAIEQHLQAVCLRAGLGAISLDLPEPSVARGHPDPGKQGISRSPMPADDAPVS